MSAAEHKGEPAMSWYLYRLLPGRPDFAATMTDQERAIMGQHVRYWSEHLAAGRVMIFTPVADPAGDWGLGIVQAPTPADAAALGDADPAVLGGVGRYEVLALPGAITAVAG